MKLLLCLLLTGCASTTLRYPNGAVALHTQADATNLTFTGPGISFHADKLTHSTATRAGGSVIGTAGTVVAGVVTEMGLGVGGF